MAEDHGFLRLRVVTAAGYGDFSIFLSMAAAGFLAQLGKMVGSTSWENR